uniref:RING-type domain-containing protein n=1 Tax=Phaeomonas parva TaxID=124430 RepID=A0A7S1XT02_9STRA|mmetsp:Transcript_31616/g.100376  ORF Transcript_31616/g.100376 Transcript_31616/m.100376 type:complete len:682 (+) Transcript_31616:321-2366(+)
MPKRRRSARLLGEQPVEDRNREEIRDRAKRARRRARNRAHDDVASDWEDGATSGEVRSTVSNSNPRATRRRMYSSTAADSARAAGSASPTTPPEAGSSLSRGASGNKSVVLVPKPTRVAAKKESPGAPRRTRLMREAVALLDGQKSAVGSDDETCRICLMSLVPEAMKDRLRGCACKPEKLPCGHFFHFGCIQVWTKRQQRCPVCRADCPIIGVGPLPEKPLGSPPAGYLYSRRDFRLGEHGAIVQELVESGLLDSHPGYALQRLYASGVHIPLVSEDALAEAERLERQIVNRARDGPRSFRIFGMRYVSAQVSGGVLEVICRALSELRDLAKRRLWVQAFVRIEALTRLMEDFDEWTAEAEMAVQAVVGICSLTWVVIAMGVASNQRARTQIQNFGDALKHGAAIIERMHDHCGMGDTRNCPLLRAHTRFLNAFARASATARQAASATEGGSACASVPVLRRTVTQLEEPSLLELMNKGTPGLVRDLEEVWEIAHATGAITSVDLTPGPGQRRRPADAPGGQVPAAPGVGTEQDDIVVPPSMRFKVDDATDQPIPIVVNTPATRVDARVENWESWLRSLGNVEGSYDTPAGGEDGAEVAAAAAADAVEGEATTSSRNQEGTPEAAVSAASATIIMTGQPGGLRRTDRTTWGLDPELLYSFMRQSEMENEPAQNQGSGSNA